MTNSEREKELLEKIEETERRLDRAESEARAWNTGKYRQTEKAKMSKMLVSGYRKDLSKLHEQLADLRK